MRASLRLFVSGAVVIACSACYHATIETGLPAGNETISVQWAHSFIYGLVPPAMVSTASKCKIGVAEVETQHSFLNRLVAGITFGIYTPVQIDITHASSNRMSSTKGSSTEPIIRAADSSFVARTAAMTQAVAQSLPSGQAVYVAF